MATLRKYKGSGNLTDKAAALIGRQLDLLKQLDISISRTALQMNQDEPYRSLRLRVHELHFDILKLLSPDNGFAHPTKLTCTNCPRLHTCEYAFDPYNTNGECLADK